MLCCWSPPPLQLVPVTRIEKQSSAAWWETSKGSEEKAEDRREETEGSRIAPALVKKPAGIVDSGAPESDT